jgi:hypothetical protein
MRCFVPGSATFGLLFAGVHDSLEKGAGGEDHSLSAVQGISGNPDAGDLAVGGFQSFDGFLAECQGGLEFDAMLHFELIGFFVSLSTRAVHGSTLAGVEHAKVDARMINDAPHFAAERVNFANDLSLGDATDRRITAHLSDGIAVHREQRSAGAHASSRKSRFNAGVTSANHDNVVVISTGRSHVTDQFR